MNDLARCDQGYRCAELNGLRNLLRVYAQNLDLVRDALGFGLDDPATALGHIAAAIGHIEDFRDQVRRDIGAGGLAYLEGQQPGQDT